MAAEAEAAHEARAKFIFTNWIMDLLWFLNNCYGKITQEIEFR